MTILVANLGAFSRIGGIERYCRLVFQALRTIAAASTTVSLWDDAADVPQHPANHVYVPCSTHKLRFIVRFGSALLRMKPDVVWLTHILFLPLVLAIRLLSPRTRIVVVAYGTEVWTRKNWFFRRLLGMTDQVMTFSRFTASKLISQQDLSDVCAKVVVLGLDPCLGNSAPPLEQQPLMIPPGRRILTVARLSLSDMQLKGVPRVIAALPRILRDVADVQYLIVGDGPARTDLERQAEECGVSRHVRFMGKLPDSRLMDCYSQCDVFVMPSCGEGFGFVYLEAMYMGLPVVTGNRDASPEVVEDGRCGLVVDPMSIPQIAEAVTRLLLDVDLRQRLAQGARSRVMSNYMYEHFVQQLAVALHEVTCSRAEA